MAQFAPWVPKIADLPPPTRFEDTCCHFGSQILPIGGFFCVARSVVAAIVASWV